MHHLTGPLSLSQTTPEILISVLVRKIEYRLYFTEIYPKTPQHLNTPIVIHLVITTRQGIFCYLLDNKIRCITEPRSYIHLFL